MLTRAENVYLSVIKLLLFALIIIGGLIDGYVSYSFIGLICLVLELFIIYLNRQPGIKVSSASDEDLRKWII